MNRPIFINIPDALFQKWDALMRWLHPIKKRKERILGWFISDDEFLIRHYAGLKYIASHEVNAHTKDEIERLGRKVFIITARYKLNYSVIRRPKVFPVINAAWNLFEELSPSWDAETADTLVEERTLYKTALSRLTDSLQRLISQAPAHLEGAINKRFLDYQSGRRRPCKKLPLIRVVPILD